MTNGPALRLPDRSVRVTDLRHWPGRAVSLPAYFVLTFAFTWTFFITAAVLSASVPAGASPGPGILALVLLGTFGPAIVAVGLSARAEGAHGVRALLAPMFRWRVPARFYLFAMSFMIAIKLAFALVYRAINHAWPPFGAGRVFLLLAAALFSTAVGGQSGEEVGWRGYALPRLAARFGLGAASILLGVIWAVWHLPLFYLHGVDTYGQSFAAYLLSVIAFSVVIAWLYWRTGGSLLLTMLMHAAINNTKDIVPAVPRTPMNPLHPSATAATWITIALLWIAAGYCLVRMRRAVLTPPAA